MKIAIGLIAGMVLIVMVAMAQIEPAERPAWTHDTRLVADWLDGHSGEAVALLESTLTQEQLDALEAVMFPAPSDEAKRAALEAAKRELQRAGLASDAKVLVEVEAELARTPVAVESPAEHRER